MKKTIFVLTTILFAVVACSSSDSSEAGGGGGGTAFCAQGATSCRCSTSAFTLQGDERNVPSCGESTSSKPWACCSDLDTSGETTECECETYLCSAGDTSCECHWSTEQSGTPTTAAECTKTGSGPYTFPIAGLCCDAGKSCNCGGLVSPTATSVCTNSEQKTTCAGTGTKRDCKFFGNNNTAGGQPRSSCSGLKWKAK